MTLRAILFDFDGVLANTEPIHLAMFQKVLTDEGLSLSSSDYYGKYLGLDDRACFRAVFWDKGRKIPKEKEDEMVQKKNQFLLSQIKGSSILLPGAMEVIEGASQKYYLAIVSGALKNEIVSILEGAGIKDKFHAIVSADQVSQGKPHPEGFEMAIRLLNRNSVPPSEMLFPSECLAIEDSPWGVKAAHKAGVQCVGVLTSYPANRLSEAELVFPDLPSIDWDEITDLFGGLVA